MGNPFGIRLYNKALTRTGWLNDPLSIVATPRHNAIGQTVITIPITHPKLSLLQPGGGDRVVITYKDEHLMSGTVVSNHATGPRTSGLQEVTVWDDIWLIWRMLGWPVPSATDPFGTQGIKKDVRTGPAETVLKGFVTANKAHLIDPVTVATNLARGSSITAESRMQNLGEQVVPQVDKAGIGISVRQIGTDKQGTSKLVECYVPTVFGHTLSEDAATVLGWEADVAADTMTRAIVGGAGEGTSREFRRRVATDRETALGYTIEDFVDARQADSYADQDAAGDAALLAAGPTTGLKISMSESGPFTYGPGGVHVGDQVTVQIGVGTVTDVLREVELRYTRDDGLLITPSIGEWTGRADRKIAKHIAASIKAIRDLRTR